MAFKSYDLVVSDSFLNYEFLSEGPKGKIIKRVEYTRFPARLLGLDPDTHVYNLGFGDVDDNGKIDGVAKTNNKDIGRVMKTVGESIIDFTSRHPDAYIFFAGIDGERQQLYNKILYRYWNIISINFLVQGYSGVRWEEYVLNKEYVAFIFRRI
jgi:hypothetical protein